MREHEARVRPIEDLTAAPAMPLRGMKELARLRPDDRGTEGAPGTSGGRTCRVDVDGVTYVGTTDQLREAFGSLALLFVVQGAEAVRVSHRGTYRGTATDAVDILQAAADIAERVDVQHWAEAARLLEEGSEPGLVIGQ